jgi:hypothetical protein
MNTRLPTQATHRNFLNIMEERNDGTAPVPADGQVTRADFDAFKKEMSDLVRNAVQPVASQRPVAPSRAPEEQSLRQRMREMAD